jgi:vitamin B12 transporter
VEPNQDFAAEWAVTPGVRGEVSSLYDPFLAPRLGLLWTWDRADSLALKANAGQLVRYPSFDDLFFPLTGLAEGNPNLKPERSTTGDIGITYRPGPLYLAATGFTQSVTNLIQWSPNFAGVWRPLNVSSALIQGIELEGRLSAIRINSFLQAGGDGSYTYLDALDESGLPNLQGNQLIYRPHEKSSFGATLIFWKDFQFSFRSRFVGYRYTTPSDTSYIPGFITYQLGLKVSLATGFDVTTTVYNLTNVNYYDVNDYPMPGTQWEIKSSLAF